MNYNITIPDKAQIEHPIFNKIRSFSEFEKGWHFGEGIKFQDERINTALTVSEVLSDIVSPKLDAFPGFNGEIALTSYPKEKYFEVIIESDACFLLTVEDENGIELIDHEEFKSLDHLIKGLQKYVQEFLWNTSEYSQNITSTQTRIGSLVSHSGILPEEVFPSLSVSVHAGITVAPVNISFSTTPWQQLHRYTGNSTNTKFVLMG
ncbi:hypothetical protein DN752_02105 [Echinicola strongylocentroti]|uniref:Uncharacterized protein n=1 Tax=Echinicola strongylocentroti TaxID=1795355 RepID=A0A2Z4IDX8_9BACT|nr:hypothetical protein [Echinicola strongylocentroti]AWW29025.1 hypothetical protein DN752_02105 [Echinicola strongylocentroti]